MANPSFGFKTPYGTLYVEWQTEYSVRVFTQQTITEYRRGELHVIAADQPLVVSGVAHHVETYFHRGGCNQPENTGYGMSHACQVHGGYQCKESRGGGCYAHHRATVEDHRFGEWAVGRVTTDSDSYKRLAVGDVDSNTTWAKITKGSIYRGINATDAKRKVIEPLIPAALLAAARSNPDASRQARIAELERLLGAAITRAERLRAEAAQADSEAAELVAKLDLIRSAQAAA